MNNNIKDSLSKIVSSIEKQSYEEYKKGLDIGKTAFVFEMKQWATYREDINKEDVLDYLKSLSSAFNYNEVRYEELLKHLKEIEKLESVKKIVEETQLQSNPMRCVEAIGKINMLLKDE